MAKGKRGIEEVDTYESDGGFVSNDDGNAPKSKKTKKNSALGNNSNSDPSWDLSSGRTPRRVNISDFKGKKLINIREYYEKDGDWLPGKKGISLTVEQYTSLLAAIPEINANLKSAGEAIGETTAMDEDQSEAETKPVKRVKAKKETKANIEATSDEEE
ncbi:transcriptional Coactivator p15-domain-containing protein [Tricladium varicosporioides]|nr:transcriptional Coactivator p15-domain-containing protein [Hymenoscyphus varicosporioides]